MKFDVWFAPELIMVILCILEALKMDNIQI